MKTILIVILVVVLIGLGAYFWKNSNQTPIVPPIEGGTATAIPGAGTAASAGGIFSGSLAELAARGGSYICTFNHQSALANSAGTIYVSGPRIRGDFLSQLKTMSIESHMIEKDGYAYTWSPITPSGLKMKVRVGAAPGVGAIPSQYADANQAYSFHCDKWATDEAKFATPPITFKESNGL